MQDGKKAGKYKQFQPFSGGGGQLFAYNYHILSFFCTQILLHTWILQLKNSKSLTWTNTKYNGSLSWFSSTPAWIVLR